LEVTLGVPDLLDYGMVIMKNLKSDMVEIKRKEEQ